MYAVRYQFLHWAETVRAGARGCVPLAQCGLCFTHLDLLGTVFELFRITTAEEIAVS